MVKPIHIGVLALQGAVAPHREKLEALGAQVSEVRTPEDLRDLQGIILPGGESTTMIHLLKLNRLWEPLADFARTLPTWGVCAGAILLADDVSSPAQTSLRAMRLSVERNAFGRQIDSFVDKLLPTSRWSTSEPVEAVFIRAPRIREVGPESHALFTWNEEIVMVREGNRLASTFHPELTDNSSIHHYFLDLCRGTR